MRIVIDLQGAQTESRYRGIGRYTMSLTKAIVQNRGNHEVIIALSALFPDTIERIRAEFDNLIPQENIRVWHAPGPTTESRPGNNWRRQVAELIREAFLAALKPDIVHVMSLFEGFEDDGVTSIGRFDTSTPVCTSLFDLIPLINPDHYLKQNKAYNEYYQRKIAYLRRSSLLLSISESSRLEGVRYLGFPSEKIINTYLAADDRFRPLEISKQWTGPFLERHGITRSFVLYSGGGDVRKNLPRLIRGYALLSAELRANHQLVFAGRIPESIVQQLKQNAKSAGLDEEDLIFTGYVSDDDLTRFYSLCKLYVFPSWHEGFGLPVLEAMSCGAAVIAANSSSLPEIVGRDDALFDPHSEADIASKLSTLLAKDDLRRDFSRHGLTQAKNFSWDTSARRAILAFEKAANASTQRHIHIDYDLNLSRLITSIATASTNDIEEHQLMLVAHSISVSLPAKRQKQLFIDISELAQRDAGTGVQRVTRSILKQFLDNPPAGYSVEPVYAVLGETGYRYARTFTAKFTDTEANGDDDNIEFEAGDIFLGLDLQHHTTRVFADFLHTMRRQGVRVYFVVYDLLPLQFPQYWPSIHQVHNIHAEWISVIASFDVAICISRAVADELAEWLTRHGPTRFRPFRISWFHLGADVENSAPTVGMTADSDSILKSINSHESFLMVGTIEPRKCHAQTLAAFEQLWADGLDINLVIVGNEGWMVEKLIRKMSLHKERKKRLFWLKGISDEYLEKVYTASSCLIAASEGEGFGLPLIEAAQHNLPIIARDIQVFREVAKEYALYFSGSDADALSSTIKEWLVLKKQGRSPVSKNIPWLTWRQSAAVLKKIVLDEDCYIRMSADWAVTRKSKD